MRGKRGDFDGHFSGSKNETEIVDLFLRVSHFGNAFALSREWPLMQLDK
jgi:hypothetical protein